MGERYGGMLKHRAQGMDCLVLTDFLRGIGPIGYTLLTPTTLTNAISSTQHRHMGPNIHMDLMHFIYVLL